eukprot:CAMPEP_0170512350 /NCGR_PEP_ID=MMETSP0208-20121228/66800_1 /TAXON_ID=197538 /ORGANISM="Strombidium inclinatum, Strain S3" /LENGTH=266 /DNA_ID=CAMNT_0010795969 /DNA_START=1259 /DNA_END=2056 /DNA_ORIENTATION=+
MMFFGLGHVVAGLTMGKIIDATSSRKAIAVNVLALAVTIGLTLTMLVQMEFNWLTFLTLFMWGYQEGVISTHTFNILGFEFESVSDPFAVFQLVQGIGVFVFELVEGLIESQDDHQFVENAFHYVIVVGIVGLTCLLLTTCFKFKQAPKPEHYYDGILSEDKAQEKRPPVEASYVSERVEDQQKQILSNYVNSITENNPEMQAKLSGFNLSQPNVEQVSNIPSSEDFGMEVQGNLEPNRNSDSSDQQQVFENSLIAKRKKFGVQKE